MLNLGSFALLPLHVVRLILSRDELKADEFTKFQVCINNNFLCEKINESFNLFECCIKAALMWTMKYGDTNSNVDWKEVFVENFMSSIQYHKIPANVLMNEVEPLKIVPYEVIMTSLAYQVRQKISIRFHFCIIFFF